MGVPFGSPWEGVHRQKYRFFCISPLFCYTVCIVHWDRNNSVFREPVRLSLRLSGQKVPSCSQGPRDSVPVGICRNGPLVCCPIRDVHLRVTSARVNETELWCRTIHLCHSRGSWYGNQGSRHKCYHQYNIQSGTCKGFVRWN